MKRILLLSVLMWIITASVSAQLSKAAKPMEWKIPGKIKSSSNKTAFATVIERENYATIDFLDDKSVVRGINAAPKALYSFPDGYYFINTSIEGMIYNEYYPMVIAPAYAASPWINRSTGHVKSSWMFFDPEADPEEGLPFFNLEEENPKVIYPAGAGAMFPALKVTNEGGEESWFNWGGNHLNEIPGGYTLHGGKVVNPYNPSIEHGATNLELDIENDYAKNTTKISEDQYLFGTNKNHFSSFAESFSKPPHPYVLSWITIGCSVLEAPKGHEFYLVIHKMEEGVPTDMIARAVATIENVQRNPSNGIDALIFQDFIIKTPEGLELTVSDLIISDEILIEFTGYYNETGVTLAACDQKNESYDGKSTAYLYRDIYENGVFVERQLKRADQVASVTGKPLKTSLDFSLGLTYSYLVTDETPVYKVSPEGGSQTFGVNSYYYPTYEDEEGNVHNVLEFLSLPEWITTDITFDEEAWLAYITFTVDALPAGTDKRSAVVTATIPGASLAFTIMQDVNNTGITTNPVSQIRVGNYNSSLELMYPGEVYSSVDIFTIDGKRVGTYRLPEEGRCVIPSNGLLKGVYLLRFTGKNTETVKIMY